MESINKEKLTYQKTVEKLEHQVSESSIRIEELTRQVNEVTSIRVRLTQENSELLKEMHEIKVHLDNANHLKSQLAAQLEDARRRLEDEERVSHLFLTRISLISPDSPPSSPTETTNSGVTCPHTGSVGRVPESPAGGRKRDPDRFGTTVVEG